MSPSTEPRTSSSTGNLIAGALGGLVVAILGAILIATGVIDTGKTERQVIRQPAIANTGATDASANSSQTGRTVAQIYKREGRGVVFVEARGVTQDSIFGSGQQGDATGSGFLVDKNGTILTNAHVVEGSNRVTVRLADNGPQIDATVKGRDPSSDLAVLKVKPSDVSNVTPVPLGNSNSAQVGDPVVAIGNPFGLDQTATTGIVSALQRQLQAPNGFSISNVIQTDASINPGNSGGPLINASGQVIGITSQIETGGGNGSVGIGFAIPSNTARQVVTQLEQNGTVQHAFLGISGTTITPEVADALNLPVKSGVLVEQAVKGGPAEKAGIRGGNTAATVAGANLSLGGDIITSVQGHKIGSMDQIVNLVNGAKPGDTLDITFRRGSVTKTVTVTLSDRPSSASGSSFGR